MLGGKNKQPKQFGYTIIEVMIVLAVSGVMFLIAANFINGKQQRTAFTEGVNDTASQLQNTIEQVTDGEYSDINLNCQFNGSSTTFPALASPGQGANSPCVFLGKLWYFSRLPSPTSSYQVLSLAGGRVDSSGAVITTPAAAYPAVVTSLTTNQVITQQLNVTKIYVNGTAPANPVQAFGFLQGQGSLDGNGNLESGAQTVSLYYVTGTLDQSKVTNIAAARSVSLCVTDDQRYALIDVGATNGNQLSVNTTVEPSGAVC